MTELRLIRNDAIEPISPGEALGSIPRPRQVTRLDIIAAETHAEADAANPVVEALHRLGGFAVDSCYYLGIDRILPPYTRR